ncbi:MAG: STAS domain-containing protein [Armatimonadetes bacterium]|nr:STAS domain-containing protein [Armatimonadota bacterium]
MSDGGLHVSSRKALSESGVTIIDVKGDLADQTADEMAQTLTRLISAGRRNIVLNLGGTDLISTQGIAQCVAAQKRLRERGGELKIAGASTELRRIFDFVSLAQVIECHPEVRHAVQAFVKVGDQKAEKPKKPRKK